VLLVAGPDLFAWVFGERWRVAGELSRALAPYIGMHFVASPLSVVPLAWGAQAWALKLALVGQLMFVLALALGLQLGGLLGGAWAVSAAMSLYFGWFFLNLPGRCPPAPQGLPA
jgi:O-antigen/teichoic acid export membrane protein